MRKARKPRRNGRAVRRDGAKACGGKKRNGDVCLREAGWGTDHPGTGKCKHHAGSTGKGIVAAAREELEGMAHPIPVTPGQAIQGLLNLAAGQLAYCSVQVGGLDESEMFEATDGGVVPNRWVRLQLAIMDRVKHITKVAADMGIQERQTLLAEAQTAMMGELLEAVMNEVGLSAAQRKKVGPAIREQLPAVLENHNVSILKEVA
jgi:hypothetical protein